MAKTPEPDERGWYRVKGEGGAHYSRRRLLEGMEVVDGPASDPATGGPLPTTYSNADEKALATAVADEEKARTQAIKDATALAKADTAANG